MDAIFTYVLEQIEAHKTGTEYIGMHVVYSGLNEQLREAGHVPDKVLADMEAAGLIVAVMRRGGPVVYLPADSPKSKAWKVTAAPKGKAEPVAVAASGVSFTPEQKAAVLAQIAAEAEA